ncbi:MAG: UDP-N-acetylmuramoyl-tripeptide--D-alanyl-D-alanine ligase [Planctomycetota bacterium]|jgi:UDP-N-acetylmuramoyl-tripeptide--D-alanyl-D-alanine ligase|uniref:UDP-N-acetylmuramoyl-tripeptide--D-alanyl-D- alanine ligase n=1 Tax=Patiriisocius sp. Uisw_047 TaxID=3230969 RepID=UPI0039EA2734
MNIKQLHTEFLASAGICTDTRHIKKGCLFFALSGDNFNGNTFAKQALELGARKVVIDQIGFHQNTSKTILTGNSLKLLQKLASFHRQYLGIPIIAITGSNGKTTTKELINVVVSKKYNTTATRGNLNNHIGVPLTLLSMTKNTELGIVEMGANHIGEIEALCTIAQPNFGYITNFGKAHLEGFGSVEGVIQGKTELYKHIANTKGLLFVNGNDPKQVALTKKEKRYTFGSEGQDCEVKLLDASKELAISYKGANIESHLIGLYNFHNIAAAIAIGNYLKVLEKDVKEAIEAYVPTNNRSQIIKQSGHTIILDAYNANPTSMTAALENFKQTAGNNKILILGDMFELGTSATEEHQAITDMIVSQDIGNVTYLVGENFSRVHCEDQRVILCPTFEDLKTQLKTKEPNTATILIKGSRGMALERVLKLL